jgi:NAD(P)-dependent dehydrogenase (short-subunit alcohol dehydrogenase family)
MTITSPFSATSTAAEVIGGHDLSGKMALITGASSGLGIEAARALLTAGAEQGAATSVWAAVANELEGIGGRYLEDCQEGQPLEPTTPRGHGYLPYVLDPERAERLWIVSQQLVGATGI